MGESPCKLGLDKDLLHKTQKNKPDASQKIRE